MKTMTDRMRQTDKQKNLATKKWDAKEDGEITEQDKGLDKRKIKTKEKQATEIEKQRKIGRKTDR